MTTIFLMCEFYTHIILLATTTCALKAGLTQRRVFAVEILEVLFSWKKMEGYFRMLHNLKYIILFFRFEAIGVNSFVYAYPQRVADAYARITPDIKNWIKSAMKAQDSKSKC